MLEKYLLDLLRPQVLPDLKLAFRHYEISSQLGYGPSSVQLSLFKIHDLIETAPNSDEKKEDQNSKFRSTKTSFSTSLLG